MRQRQGDLETRSHGEKGNFEVMKLRRWGGQEIRVSEDQDIRGETKRKEVLKIGSWKDGKKEGKVQMTNVGTQIR